MKEIWEEFSQTISVGTFLLRIVVELFFYRFFHLVPFGFILFGEAIPECALRWRPGRRETSASVPLPYLGVPPGLQTATQSNSSQTGRGAGNSSESARRR